VSRWNRNQTIAPILGTEAVVRSQSCSENKYGRLIALMNESKYGVMDPWKGEKLNLAFSHRGSLIEEKYKGASLCGHETCPKFDKQLIKNREFYILSAPSTNCFQHL
jgi:hypothetical protein